MKLDDYLTRNDICMADFAKKVETTPATICRVIKQQVVPRRRLIVAIHHETEGAVQPNDLIQIP